MREAVLAALRRAPELVPKLTKHLRQRIAGEQGRAATVVQAAVSLEPVLADAVRMRPSRLGQLGLKSTHLLASLAAEDESSNRLLAQIGKGSPIGIAFVDIADFVAFTDRFGDDAAIELIGELSQIIERSIERARGMIVKKLGDGFLLAFPSASQAVRGALAARSGAICRHGRGRPHTFQIRIAVHAGEPLIEEDDLLGHDVNLTARLLDHCCPGEIVVSEAAKELAERRLRKASFGNRRRVKIRGLVGPVTIYSVNPEEGGDSAELVASRVEQLRQGRVSG